ncbi:MAG: hypothetical protein L6R40_004739 [Gallowayella cf. fulva]|nr:MAG: hypothetical protein L6R40_004739 [Xanthomendoza cf. fulva]
MATSNDHPLEQTPPPDTPAITLSEEEEAQCAKQAEAALEETLLTIRSIDTTFSEVLRSSEHKIHIINLDTGGDEHETVLSDEDTRRLYEEHLEELRRAMMERKEKEREREREVWTGYYERLARARKVFNEGKGRKEGEGEGKEEEREEGKEEGGKKEEGEGKKKEGGEGKVVGEM